MTKFGATVQIRSFQFHPNLLSSSIPYRRLALQELVAVFQIKCHDNNTRAVLTEVGGGA